MEVLGQTTQCDTYRKFTCPPREVPFVGVDTEASRVEIPLARKERQVPKRRLCLKAKAAPQRRGKQNNSTSRFVSCGRNRPGRGVNFSFTWGSPGQLSSPQGPAPEASPSPVPFQGEPEDWRVGNQDSANPASCCEGTALVSPGPCGA